MITDKELSEYFHAARHDLYREWIDRLRGIWGEGAETKLSYIHANRESGSDLFSLLLESFKKDIEIFNLNIESLYKKIRSLDYSVSDYYKENLCLRQCLGQHLRSLGVWTENHLVDGIIAMHQRLDEITMRVLQECSEFFEHIAETSKTAFCQTDLDGRIVFANREMNRLTQEETVIGHELSLYFEKDDKKIVTDTILNHNQPWPTILRLKLISSNEKHIPVVSEIGPLMINGRYKGGYAHFTDVSLVDQQNNQLFDRALLGIVKLNCNGDILFANKSMLQILNMSDYQGVNVYDLLPDDETKKTVKDYLDSRTKGRSDEYKLNLVRYGDKITVPVMVSAFPETDLSGNKVIGSFAIVRCLVAERMHHHIESRHQNEAEMLEKVAKELSLVVDYDCITVAKYSNDLRFACSIFSNNAGRGHRWQRRWWKLTPSQIKWASQKEILLIEDLETFLDNPDWIEIKTEPDVQQILADDFKSFIFYPIFRNQRLVASISLLNKSNHRFKKHHKQLLRNLPLDSAVHMALSYHNRREQGFTSDIIKNLANSGSNVKSIAAIIVAAVAAHYKWDSVSLYKVNPIKKVIHLLEQAASNDKYLLAKNYEQKIDEGVLGYVSQHKAIVNIGNVDENEKFKDMYLHAVKPAHMKSELCIPITFSGTFWLLNIEDQQIDAFHQEEQKEICTVMNNVCEYLESNWLNRFLEASMNAGTDAILLSDIEGRIIQVNPMAIDMLPITMVQNHRLSTPAEETEFRGPMLRIQPVPFQSLFADPSDADLKITASYQTPTDIKLKRRDGGTMPALLTGVNLQEDFGYTIHIAADMTAQQRLKQIENLEQIYHEIAIQTKTPISLIGGWAKRIKKYDTISVLKESVDKILRQLKKLEVTYDRLALYSADRNTLLPTITFLDIAEVIEAIKNDLPISDLDLIKWKYGKGQCFLNGDMFQLKFCFETILLHLLRYVPQDDLISVNINADGDKISVNITGWYPQKIKMSAQTPEEKNDVAKGIADMALGEKLVGRFIRSHGGTYIRPDQTDEKITFRFELPRLEGI